MGKTMTTSQNLKEWRKKHGWTKKQAAEKLGLSFHTIVACELGRRKIRDNLVVSMNGIDAMVQMQEYLLKKEKL